MDENEAKIDSFKGGLRGSGDGTHAHAPSGHRTRLQIYFLFLTLLAVRFFVCYTRPGLYILIINK